MLTTQAHPSGSVGDAVGHGVTSGADHKVPAGVLVDWVNERGHIEESDAVLLVLLHLAPFDDFAARTALQALMPAVKRMTAKFSTCGAWCAEETAAVIVWERIRGYPAARRPWKVSSNLAPAAELQVLDVLQGGVRHL